MEKRKLTIEGMTCNHCVMAVKKELTGAGITVLQAGNPTFEIEGQTEQVTKENLSALVKEAGYTLKEILTIG